MLLIFSNLFDMEDSDTMVWALCVGQRLYKSDEMIQLCEIHKLSRLVW